MRALVLPSLSIESRPDPTVHDGEILVQVHAAGINRADLAQRAGRYPAPPGWPDDIPGLEYAGEVVATGSGVTYWKVGDRVMGLVGGGAQAEYLVVRQEEAIAVPARLTYPESAAIPEAFLTAWDAIAHQGRAWAGERVLIHAIGSGVGTAAAQLGEILGVTIIGTSRTADKLHRAAGLGMAHGVDTTDTDWVDRVGGPVDVIIDTLGAGFFDANMSLLASGGRLVILGTLTGSVAERIDLGRVLRQRLGIVGTAMRSRGSSERMELVRKFTGEILPHLASGAISPVVHATVPFDDAARGYQMLASNEAFGKVVIEV